MDARVGMKVIVAIKVDLARLESKINKLCLIILSGLRGLPNGFDLPRP